MFVETGIACALFWVSYFRNIAAAVVLCALISSCCSLQGTSCFKVDPRSFIPGFSPSKWSEWFSRVFKACCFFVNLFHVGWLCNLWEKWGLREYKWIFTNQSFLTNPKQGLYEYSHSNTVFRDDTQCATCVSGTGNISTGQKNKQTKHIVNAAKMKTSHWYIFLWCSGHRTTLLPNEKFLPDWHLGQRRRGLYWALPC